MEPTFFYPGEMPTFHLNLTPLRSGVESPALAGLGAPLVHQLLDL